MPQAKYIRPKKPAITTATKCLQLCSLKQIKRPYLLISIPIVVTLALLLGVSFIAAPSSKEMSSRQAIVVPVSFKDQTLEDNGTINENPSNENPGNENPDKAHSTPTSPSTPLAAREGRHTDINKTALTTAVTSTTVNSTTESSGANVNIEHSLTANLAKQATQGTSAALSTDLKSDLTWKQQTVRSGDNLSTIFQRVSLTARDVHRLMSSTPLAKPLIDMRPGQTLHFGFNSNGELGQLKYIKTKLESYLYKQVTNAEGNRHFIGEHILLSPELMLAYRESAIEDSLFLAGERAQLPHNLIMELANIFGWDVDFALDIRKGDSFSLLFEEKFLHGEKIGHGNILAAEFINQGKSFKAVRYEDSNGRANYYTPNGLSMRKAFLRAPLDFTRISSGFNLRRKHPIHKKIRAHRGVDYAAPRGTPIFSAGDGKVTASGYSKANGNYVFIQHGQRFTTKYLHLHKRKVRKGQVVRQRQVIGTVGSTGYATGPHLHYEFLVNGVHRNPRTVKLPQAEPIDSKEKQRFETKTASLMAQLAGYQEDTQLAMNVSNKTNFSNKKPLSEPQSSNN